MMATRPLLFVLANALFRVHSTLLQFLTNKNKCDHFGIHVAQSINFCWRQRRREFFQNYRARRVDLTLVISLLLLQPFVVTLKCRLKEGSNCFLILNALSIG